MHHLNAAKLTDAMSRHAPGDAGAVDLRSSMLDVLQGFVHELRAAGLPVSMTENLDAMRAVEHVDIADRDTFKAALGATLVKHHHHWRAFETVFDVYFSLYASGVGEEGEDGAPLDPSRWRQCAARAAVRWATSLPRSWRRCCSRRS